MVIISLNKFSHETYIMPTKLFGAAILTINLGLTASYDM